MLSQGTAFIQAQNPVDFAHWFLLIGATLMISFSLVFPKSSFNSLATVLVILGIVAHIGMCALDFQFWSFGEDIVGRDNLINHLRGIPSIWLPFMDIGPALLYIGLSIHAWKFIKTHTIRAIFTIVGTIIIGLGHYISDNRIIVVLGYVLLALGLVLLIYRKDNRIDASLNKL